MSQKLTLPTDSNERKDYALLRGCLRYFPAALAGVARISKIGNDKHNPGEEMYHARGKSMDHGDCIVRHLMDLQDLLAIYEKEQIKAIGSDKALDKLYELQNSIKTEASSLAWRALALSQELHEQFGAPLAPGAKVAEGGPLTEAEVADMAQKWGRVGQVVTYSMPSHINLKGYFNDIGEFIPTPKPDGSFEA